MIHKPSHILEIFKILAGAVQNKAEYPVRDILVTFGTKPSLFVFSHGNIPYTYATTH